VVVPGALLALVVAVVVVYLTLSRDGGRATPHDAAAVARGRVVYQQNCSSCHGANLEGQPNWYVRQPNGRLPAPPHDASGHTWHHPDDVLFGIVKNGLVPPYAPPGYASDMPAFGSTWPDDDIRAVLAFVESRWPPEVWRMRDEMIGSASRRSR
jgi:mono/diheme cytochrome c family protein